jgi:hypothetical protein
MPYAEWGAVARDLASALERLEDGDFLIMGESAHEARRGLFGRHLRPVASRYVQVLRVDDVLSAECVGALALGGTWPMDEPTIGRLCEMGWQTPAETRAEYGTATPNFEVHVDLAATAALCDLMVASLVVLGADPLRLVLQSSGDGLSARSG